MLIKADCHALKVRNKKAQRVYHKSGRHEEVNYINVSVEVNPNILCIENPVELEVLLTIEELSTWLLDSSASYHVTPHRSQIWQYSNPHFDSIRVGNSQCCLLAGLATTQVFFRTLLQRGGKVRMSDHTRKIKIISTDGKEIQIQR